MSRVRSGTLAALVAVAGLAVAYVDSRPGWDDTGVTVAAIAIIACVGAAVSGRRPWLWAILAGIWTPAIEISTSGQLASSVALLVAAVGAAVGYGLARLAGRGVDPTPDRPAG
jgi:hypothetical protein